jgi:hypothetical protein
MDALTKRATAAALVLAACLSSAPAAAAPRLVVLATDPELDALPGADLTHIAVGRDGPDLVVEIGVANMLHRLRRRHDRDQARLRGAAMMDGLR